MSEPFSVIIPAHNEESVIGRCLRAILASAPEDRSCEIIVVANGCTDRTVAIARECAPQAIILDLPQGSKFMALNEGNRIARYEPRLFLDADVRCDYPSLAATADALRRPGISAASPSIRVDLERCDSLVKRFYRVWLTQPYVVDRMVGSGLYGLSNRGLAVIGEFPPIFGDDIWVKTRFPDEERLSVSHDDQGRPAFFTVSPPRTFVDLVRIEARRRIGDDEVRSRYPTVQSGRRTSASSLRNAVGKGISVVDLAIYLSVKTLAQIVYRISRLRGQGPVWVRDIAARS